MLLHVQKIEEGISFGRTDAAPDAARRQHEKTPGIIKQQRNKAQEKAFTELHRRLEDLDT